MDSNLIKKIKAKFVSLKDVIIERIDKIKNELVISNLEFAFDSESIKPVLTALNGYQVVQAC